MWLLTTTNGTCVITAVPLLFIALGVQGEHVVDVAKSWVEQLADSKSLAPAAVVLAVGTILSVTFGGFTFAFALYGLYTGSSSSAINKVTFVGSLFLCNCSGVGVQ